MNNDRIKGPANEIARTAKEFVGKATDDAKLATKGKIEKVEGATQNAVGELKDVVSDVVKP